MPDWIWWLPVVLVPLVIGLYRYFRKPPLLMSDVRVRLVADPYPQQAMELDRADGALRLVLVQDLGTQTCDLSPGSGEKDDAH